MSERRQKAEREAAAEHNIDLGWCPCGEEKDYECECGVSRLSYTQGLAEPLKRSYEHADYAKEAEGG